VADRTLKAGEAVVAGMDLNGLGVVRSLARGGVRVTIIDTDIAKPTMKSRFGTKIKVAAMSGPLFVEELVKLRARFTANPVLFLTQEASVATVSEARAALADLYRFTVPKTEIMYALMDKGGFQLLAERNGFAIPRTVLLSGAADIDLIRGLRFPCVLKPARKETAYGERFAKAYRVTTLGEAYQLWKQVSEVVTDVVIQEWVDGDDTDVYFCLQHIAPDGATVSFAGRKLVQWPPLVGGTALCVPAPRESSVLIDLTSRFFASVGFMGLGSMEYKRDRRDGVFYMIEPTVGRTDYQEEIAALNGVNIALEAFRSELGLPTSHDAMTNRPRAWCDPIGIANARKIGAGSFPAEALRGISVSDAYFRSYDPLPYLALRGRMARAAIARRFGMRVNP
jgi:predicted ATP-grasp superfamily ATP-dependent carboligase